MDVIDGNWIKSRLSGERGEQTRLARYLGISTDKLTKVLSGKRNVQPREAPLVIKFFDEKYGTNQKLPEDLLRQIGRLNSTGQRVLQIQLNALLESEEFSLPAERPDEDD